MLNALVAVWGVVLCETFSIAHKTHLKTQSESSSVWYSWFRLCGGNIVIFCLKLSLFLISGILERISQTNNWKFKPGDMDLQWFGCNFSVYFEVFFPLAQTILYMKKGVGYFFSSCRTGSTFFSVLGALIYILSFQVCSSGAVRGQVFKKLEQFSLGEGSLQVQVLPLLARLPPAAV